MKTGLDLEKFLYLFILNLYKCYIRKILEYKHLNRYKLTKNHNFLKDHVKVR